MFECDNTKQVFAEARGSGFETNALRSIARLRNENLAEQREEEAILDLYMAARSRA